MKGEAFPERVRFVLGPGFWLGCAVMAGLAAHVVEAGALLKDTAQTEALAWIGLLIGVTGLVAAEVYRRHALDEDRAEIQSQSFSGVAMMGAGVVLGAFVIQANASSIRDTIPVANGTSLAALAIIMIAAAQIIASTARLILRGRAASARVESTEREAHAAELLAVQQRLEPELLSHLMSAIAERAESNPADAERAVEALAVYLRRSLHHPPVLEVALAQDIDRAVEYGDILALTGAVVPITWNVDPDVLSITVPHATLRTFLDYAMARCLRDSGNQPAITVRAYCHAGRFFLLVHDTAAPDPPMLEEPESLMALRRRLGAPPQRRVRVETHVMLEVDGTASGTTQSLVFRLPEAA